MASKIHSSSPRWIIAIGIALLALAGWWLASRSGRARTEPVPGRTPPSEERTQLARPGTELVEPAAEGARVAAPEPEQPAQAAETDSPRLRFVYDDGTPAVGIGFYPACVLSTRVGSGTEYSTPNLVVRAEDAASGQTVGVRMENMQSFGFDLALKSRSPIWSIRTDTKGEVAFPAAETLAPIAAARMSADAVVLLPVNPEQCDRHVLPSVVSQEIILAGATTSEQVVVEAILSSADLSAFLHGGDDDPRPPSHDFADQHLVLAQSLDSPRVVAWRVLRMTPTAPLERVSLPQGSYELVIRTCTFGWWARPLTFEAGAPVVLDVYRTPLAQISCFDPRSDERRVPRHVCLYGVRESRQYHRRWGTP